MQTTTDIQQKTYEIALMMPEEGSYEEIKTMIAAHGGQVLVEGAPKRLALAYPIKKATHAVFTYLHVLLSPESAKMIEKEMLHNQHIIRGMVLVVPPVKPPKVKKEKKDKEGKEKEGGVKKTKKATDGGALTNEALEKTIQEMM